MHSAEYKILSHLYTTNGMCPIAYKDTLTADELVFFDHLMQTRQVAYTGGTPDGLGGVENQSFISITKIGMRSFLSEKERLDAIDDQAAQDAQHKASERRFSLIKAFFGFLQSLASLNPVKLIEYIKSIL